MGRGRAKAKQTKVARDLKYRTHETDFGALARELHGGDTPDGVADLKEADDLEDQDLGDTDLEDDDLDEDDDGWSDYQPVHR